MITWKDTIHIICEMFEISQQQLAGYLCVGEGTLSRIKNGKARASIDNTAVFNAVFNPDTKSSPAHSKNESKAKLLELLKEIIEFSFPKVREAMADCWDEPDYQLFVLRLLGRTRQVRSSGEKNVASDDDGVTIDPCGKDEPAPVVDMPLDSSSSQVCVPPPLEANTSEQSPDNATRGSQIADEVSDSTLGGQAVSRSEPGETESKTVGQSSDADTAGGAQLHVEDKYKCCRFCTKWRGVMGDELAICRVFKEQRDAASGRGCKYYKPDWGQITIEMI